MKQFTSLADNKWLKGLASKRRVYLTLAMALLLTLFMLFVGLDHNTMGEYCRVLTPAETATGTANWSSQGMSCIILWMPLLTMAGLNFIVLVLICYAFLVIVSVIFLFIKKILKLIKRIIYVEKRGQYD